ncbi:unnamed protein product, partial [Polarella glacialis]
SSSRCPSPSLAGKSCREASPSPCRGNNSSNNSSNSNNGVRRGDPHGGGSPRRGGILSSPSPAAVSSSSGTGAADDPFPCRGRFSGERYRMDCARLREALAASRREVSSLRLAHCGLLDGGMG